MMTSTALDPHSRPTRSTWGKDTESIITLSYWQCSPFRNTFNDILQKFYDRCGVVDDEKFHFVPMEGINIKVGTAYICHYLGKNASVREGHYTNPQTGQIQTGYYIRASQILTAEMVEIIKSKSMEFEAELRVVLAENSLASWLNCVALRGVFDSDLPRPVKVESFPWTDPNSQLYENSKKQKDQLEFLKILWGFLDAIIELMQTVRVYTALILDTVSSGFSEFPNSMRPPCTTMPWTIWPALVVLWGVCWMFDTRPNTTDELQLQLCLQAAEPTLSSNSDALFNPFGTPSWTSQDVSNCLLSEDLSFNTNSFEWWNDGELNQIPPSGPSDKALDTFSGYVAPSLLVQQISNSASPIDDFGFSTSVEQYPITVSSSKPSTLPLHNEDATTGFTIGANTQARQIAPSPQASTTYTRSERPPQNSDGDMICDHLDCSSKNLIFTNIGEWSKHKNKHERPYKCTINPCTRNQGFASKSDRLRHERTVHKTLHNGVGMQGSASTKTLFFCDEPNCKRGPGGANVGFTRRDNLMDHVRRRHKRVLASSRVSMRGEDGVNGVTMPENQSLAAPLPEEQQINSLVVIPGRQKRTATEASGTIAEEMNALKKPRQEDHGSSVDTERTPREEALTQEVEKLKKALEEKQKQNEVLISIIDRLTQGPK